jgi:hypothetical protein
MRNSFCVLFISFSFVNNLTSDTVIITHGTGINGVSYYKKSAYVTEFTKCAKKLGHTVKTISWFSKDIPTNDKYTGVLPQERILGAVIIAKAILDEYLCGNNIILIGHGYGGQVVRCACRLLNPVNKNCGDSFIYDLVYAIKYLCAQKDCDKTKSFNLSSFISFLTLGWSLTQTLFSTIEKANLINSNLIKFVKQKISLEFLEEIKSSWDNAWHEVQKYKNKLLSSKFNCKKIIKKLITIGTVHNGRNDTVFSEDPDVIEHWINFYSSGDYLFCLPRNYCSPEHRQGVNLQVFFDGCSPKHDEFCGNIIMAQWVLLIPDALMSLCKGHFENFKWGKDACVNFYTDKFPVYNVMKMYRSDNRKKYFYANKNI